MNRKKLYALNIIIVLVSFLGFCVENIWLACTKGYMNNRGMGLPFLLGYGLAIAAIYFLFGTPKEIRFLWKKLPVRNLAVSFCVYFAIVCLCVSLGEIALGTLVEKTTGIVWWDYTNLPLNITKYTSIPTTLGFGALITIFMGCFFVPLYRWLQTRNTKGLRVVSGAMMLLLTADLLGSAGYMLLQGDVRRHWKWKLGKTVARLIV